jgi:hypothetical protein
MTTIRCQDAFILTTDFDACAKELNASHAAFQTPLHVTCGEAARRAVIPCIRVHGLAIEFDESKSTKSAVVAVLAKYGFRLQPQEETCLPASLVHPMQPRNRLNVLTAPAA